MNKFINSFTENRIRIKAYLLTKDESVLADEQKPFILIPQFEELRKSWLTLRDLRQSEELDKMTETIQEAIERVRRIKQC